MIKDDYVREYECLNGLYTPIFLKLDSIFSLALGNLQAYLILIRSFFHFLVSKSLNLNFFFIAYMNNKPCHEHVCCFFIIDVHVATVVIFLDVASIQYRDG